MDDNKYENYDADSVKKQEEGKTPAQDGKAELQQTGMNHKAGNFGRDKTSKDKNTKNKTSKDKGPGFGMGILLGMVVMGLICALLVFLFSSNLITKIREHNAETTELSLGDDVAQKMNLLMQFIDKYFLYDDQNSSEDMADAVYKAMFESLGDKYSVYYTAEEYKKVTESTNGSFSGIGAVVTQDTDTEAVMIVYPYEDSPAEEAGLQAEDLIIGVDGTNIVGMDLDQVVSMMRGEEGTSVTLTIKRGDETFDVEVTRRVIDVTTVGYEMLENDIGYIVISQFAQTTVDQFTAAIDDLNSQGMKGLIVDIRSNPGGMLTSVVSMLDYILPEGTLVYTLDKNGNRKEYSSEASCNLDVPCAILVNGQSASASEIFAGAMQDYDKAEIIGTQTYGKGIVQTIFGLKDGSAIKLTVEDYYTPNGKNIQGVGITPDEVVELDTEAYQKDGSDNQLQAAIDYLMDEIQ